jgi:hypothetical protein
MLQKIKSVLRDVKDGAPGRRFVDHHERTRRREGVRGSAWRSSGIAVVGLVLLVCGLVLSLPPGVPGFLLWIPGLALIASRSRYISILLDRLEAGTRRAWRALRTSRRQ